MGNVDGSIKGLRWYSFKKRFKRRLINNFVETFKLFLCHMSITLLFFLSVNYICHQCTISVAVLIQTKILSNIVLCCPH